MADGRKGMMRGADGEKKEEEEALTKFVNIDKGQLLQEKRLFSESPLNNRKCRELIEKLLYLVVVHPDPSAQLTRTEATDLFFATTKLFQSRDIPLRRSMNLLLKELVPLANDVIIIISSLTKDMTSKNDAYRSTAIRLLSKITDALVLAQVDRYLKASVVDKEPSVASAALVSGIHLMQSCPDVVRRWAGEVQEAVQSRQVMVQYHALGLLHAIRRNDRLAVAKLVSASNINGIKSSMAQCLLIRFARQVLLDDPSPETNRPLLQYLDGCLRHPSDMVVLEAARALCEIPRLPAKELVTAVADLQLFLNSSKSTLRFASVKTLNKLAAVHPGLVSACNIDLENLANDSNRSVATLAISCLLKTGTEFSVDRLVKLISSFIGDVPDEFKVQLVEALRTLCLKFESKAKTLVGFLSSMLREEGGYEFKAAIVRAIVAVINKSPELKEAGLTHLCEFIEDSEYPVLTTEVLSLLAEEGPSMPSASRFMRYVYNRTALENATVRAAAVAALAKFGMRNPSLRPQVVTLLGRCAYDGEDDVRDRAVYFLGALEAAVKEESKAAFLPAMIAPSLTVPVENLVSSLEAYLSSESPCDKPFDLAAVPTQLPEHLLKKQQAAAVAAAIASGESAAAAASAPIAACVPAHALSAGVGISAVASKVAQNPELAGLGQLWHASAVDLPLTEKETEYVVTYRKYTFPGHVAFEFTVNNTLKEQQLENVTVALTPAETASGFDVEKTVPAAVVACGLPAVAYTIVAVPDGAFAAKFTCSLRFTAKEVDDATGEVAESGDEDEYPLDEAEINVGDFVQPAFVATFDKEWEKMGDASQAVEMYNLASMKTIPDAVRETATFLGMLPVEGTGTVSSTVKKHILLMGGKFLGDIPVLGRVRMRLDPSGSGVAMELTVRCPKPELATLLATSV